MCGYGCVMFLREKWGIHAELRYCTFDLTATNPTHAVSSLLVCLVILVCIKEFSGELVDHYPWHFQSTAICQYSKAQWDCIIELRALGFHMLWAQVPSGIPVTLDGMQKMDRIRLCAVDWPWPICWPTSSLNHMIPFWSIKQVKVLENVTQWWMCPLWICAFLHQY